MKSKLHTKKEHIYNLEDDKNLILKLYQLYCEKDSKIFNELCIPSDVQETLNQLFVLVKLKISYDKYFEIAMEKIQSIPHKLREIIIDFINKYKEAFSPKGQ